eukprot:scaffold511289_cov18-Prasinocladus_malaysianus.AAC.1
MTRAMLTRRMLGLRGTGIPPGHELGANCSACNTPITYSHAPPTRQYNGTTLNKDALMDHEPCELGGSSLLALRTTEDGTSRPRSNVLAKDMDQKPGGGKRTNEARVQDQRIS